MRNPNENASQINQKRWDELAKVHYEAAMAQGTEYYDLEGFKQGKTSLFATELSELPNLMGKRLLHLQCHFGMDTLSLARMGAEVVGVDYSAEAVKLASELAKEVGIKAKFIQSDIYKLREKMAGDKETFDFVYTSHGVLCWLYDLKDWGEIIAYFLKPGGQFYVIDGHPTAGMFYNEPDATDLTLVVPYFTGGKAYKYVSEGSYIDAGKNKSSISVGESYEWFHTISDIIMALINAGLELEFFHEHLDTSWKAFPFAHESENGMWRVDHKGLNIPLTFSILAKKR